MSLFRLCFLMFCSLTACGSPSPWSNATPARYHDLTKKSLDRLDQFHDGPQSFSVGLIADPQVTPGALRTVAQLLDQRENLAFSIILGDLTDRSLNAEFVWVAESVERARVPILTVVGNHDGLLYGEETYQRMFGDLNYSFIYRGVKFLFWNNNPYEWGYPDFDWLRDEIASFPRTIIIAHQPPGGIDRFERANAELREIFEDPNVMGSVHGHKHTWNLQWIAGRPAVTVARVRGDNFGIMHVHADSRLTFERCQGDQCR